LVERLDRVTFTSDNGNCGVSKMGQPCSPKIAQGETEIQKSVVKRGGKKISAQWKTTRPRW